MRRPFSLGTRSVLFGVHCFLIHWFFVALGWYKVYGFRRVEIGRRVKMYGKTPILYVDGLPVEREYASLFRPALWVAFLVHDFGYWGKPNMDGPEGEEHPWLGAKIMQNLFGNPWGTFALYHSRYMAKRVRMTPSPLCIADKYAIILEPSWLYLPRAWASGELHEYLVVAKQRCERSPEGLTSGEYDQLRSGRAVAWHQGVKAYMRRWIAEHKDGKADTWTKERAQGFA